MLSTRAGAVVFAKDLPRVARFYEELLGLTVVHGDADHAVLSSPDVELVIHAIPKRVADTFEIAVPPARREDSALKLFFFVNRIADARIAAARLGGVIDPPQREWSARGFTACDGHDPEGNVIQVREALPAAS
jgi:predicted enzyme related to lactoylglutathione lyase